MTETLHDAAVSYARDYGLAIHPLKVRDKTPATRNGFKDATTDTRQIEATWDRNPNLNIGASLGAPSGNIICIDIDIDDDENYDGMEFLRKWERERGELPETVSAITGRGGCHLYYRVDREIRPSANDELHIDIRGDGSYVVLPPSIHPNTGRTYEWENHPEDHDFVEADENVYAFIEAVRPKGFSDKNKRFELPEKIEKGARNDTLYRYACSLQEKGREDSEIMDAVQGANVTRCAPPLKGDEVKTLVASALGHNKGKSPKSVKAKGLSSLLSHNEFAQMLMKVEHVCIVDGGPAAWNGRYYEYGWDAISRAILKHDDSCKLKNQKEIREYIRLKAPQVDSAPAIKLAFSNGVLNIETDDIEDWGPETVITNVIPHCYDPNAYDKATDDFLDRVSCGDRIIRANLEETIGLCMYRSNEYGICIILLGRGSNGKSVYLSAVRNAIGAENTSSLDLSLIGPNFAVSSLLGKLANLGDDIANGRISGKGLSVFKKVVTGERLFADVKGKEGFEFEPYCTLVFSANEMPSLGDSSEGMMRRLFPIPFDATFKRTDPDYDPRMKDKLTSENAAKYLCALGVKGLRRVIEQDGMTPNARSDEMAREIKVDSDPVAQWIESECIEATDVIDRPTKEVHAEYTQWCSETCSETFALRKFTARVNERFELKSDRKRLNFADGSRVVQAFMRK